MLPKNWKKEIDQTISEAKSVYTDAQNRAAKINREIAASIKVFADQLERYNDKQNRDEPRNRYRENLTIGGLIATAVFTFALATFALWQVVETRRAYDPIKESADAAKDSVSAIREQMRLDQRAWIGIHTMDAIPYFPEVGKSFSGHGIIKNTGKTPALNTVIYAIIEPVLTEERPNFLYTGIKSFSAGMLAPNGTGHIGPLPIPKAGSTEAAIFSQEQIDLLKQTRFGIYMHGRIEYADIFGNNHWTTYCSFLLPTGGFAHCYEHNETDENQKNKK